jgi:aryl-alcohol dehydrogenase-like predicted oxidoreductase
VTISLTRRDFATAGGAALLAPAVLTAPVLMPPALAEDAAQNSALLTRAIPVSGERLPAVGLGTAYVFNTNDDATRQKAAAVVQALIAGGGRLIDTASVYGDAEAALGETIVPAGLRDKIFIATKLEAPDAAELKRSQARLQTQKFDLLQFHNVGDPQQSLAQFKDWKAQGLCRYIGITSTRHEQYAAIEAVLLREKPDFVQIDYSLDDREAEKRILPAAAEAKAAVLTALPFGRARLFRAVHGKELPDWARGFAATWAQFFLKYLLSDPRVTAVIPGTADPAHMTDNLGALRGPLPDPDQRKRMEAFADTL